MEIAVVLNANKKFYVLEDGVAMEGYDGITVVDKYYGTYSFPVKAGKTYTTSVQVLNWDSLVSRLLRKAALPVSLILLSTKKW